MCWFNVVGTNYIPKSISSIGADGTVVYNESCVDGRAKTTGQRIGMTPNDPTATNGSIALGQLPAKQQKLC